MVLSLRCKLMWCPACKSLEVKVVDSRYVSGSNTIRRRRLCTSCQFRFTTREYVEVRLPRVIKRDGRRCQFVESKLRRGIMLALEKRNVTGEDLELFFNAVIAKISQGSQGDEVTTAQIGSIVLGALRDLDEVAYIRFASVYKSFSSIESFRAVVDDLEEARPLETT